MQHVIQTDSAGCFQLLHLPCRIDVLTNWINSSLAILFFHPYLTNSLSVLWEGMKFVTPLTGQYYYNYGNRPVMEEEILCLH